MKIVVWTAILMGSLASIFSTPMPALASVPGRSQVPAALDREVPKILLAKKISSVSIARIEDGKLAFVAAYGLQAPGVPATPSTLYNIASMTKPITAELVLRLASAGRLSLDEPMYKYWLDPDIAHDERAMLLTPRLALSHQTGFPNWRRETGGVLVFKRKPGGAFGYSGEGYQYVARFAQRKTATDFEALAKRMVFSPLGMHDTAYTQQSWFAGRVALPSDANGQWLQAEMTNVPNAADLIYSTPGDYAKLMIGIMQRQGVSAAIAAERSRVQVDRKAEVCAGSKARACPDAVGMGLGWEVVRFGRQTFLMHTGMDQGVLTLGYLDPVSGSGTIIFTNSSNGPQVVMPILDLLGKDKAFLEYLRGQAG